MSLNIKAIAKNTARDLRKNQTEAEKKLWNYLRNRRLDNIKFLRQKQIIVNVHNKERFFVADFYCGQFKIIIEVDGEIHKKQRATDGIREEVLKEKGYKVIRFKNEEIIKDIENVLNKIREFTETHPLAG